MKCRNPSRGARERRGIPGMGVHDGAHVIAGFEYVAMKPPFARRSAAAEPAAIQVHERHIVGLEGVVSHAGRTDKKMLLVTANTDIAGGAIGQTATRERATGGNYRFAQFLVTDRAVG